MVKFDPSTIRVAMRVCGVVLVSIASVVPDPWRAVVLALGTAVASWANRAPGMIDASNPVEVMKAAKSIAPPVMTAPISPPPFPDGR